MKRIGLFFLVLLILSACGGTQQASDLVKSAEGEAQKNAARLQRQTERQKAKLQQARREARRIARQEILQEARQAAREARRKAARRLARATEREEAEQEAQAVAAAPAQNCDYEPCLAPASDYDCAGGSGDGPAYTGPVRVIGSDPYGLDSDGDGWGCES